MRHFQSHNFVAGTIAVVSLLTGLGFFLWCRLANPRAASPRYTLNVGSQRRGTLSTHEFLIMNDGLTRLCLGIPQPDCGCTNAHLSARVIPPGRSATLSTTLNLTGLNGVFVKRIRIPTNDPANRDLVFTLKGEAVGTVRAIPGVIRIDPENITRGSVVSVDLEIEPPERASITGASCLSTLFTVDTIRLIDARHYRLLLHLPFPAPATREDTYIVVDTDHPRESRLIIPVTWCRRALKHAPNDPSRENHSST